MDNQDLTTDRRLKAKDELIAELLEALNEVHEWFTEDTPFEWPNQQEAEKAYALAKAVKQAIRKAKE